jgi:predicted DsbA family dithiol-disulfide isomerase
MEVRTGAAVLHPCNGGTGALAFPGRRRYVARAPAVRCIHASTGSEPMTKARVPVLVFSDFACPYCFVSDRMLERRAASGDLDIVHRAYELFPMGSELSEPEAWPDALRGIARAVGIEPPERLPARPRTGKAHELAYLAAEAGAGAEVRRAIFEAFWQADRDIGRVDVLVEIGTAHGLDAGLVKATLDVDRFTPHVARDREAAAKLGIEAVPAMIFGTGGRAVLLLGTHGAEALDEAVRAARPDAPA